MLPGVTTVRFMEMIVGAQRLETYHELGGSARDCTYVDANKWRPNI